jgi:hypothetical protein
MATPIEVIATGIIMFAHGSSMRSEPAAAMRAAIAIEVPGPRTGSYGVKIPEHEARLVIPKAAASIISDPQARATTVHENAEPALPGVAAIPAADYYIIHLRGDRIQFGTVQVGSAGRKTCMPTPIDPNGPDTSGIATTVPNIADLAASPQLAADAFPHHDNYSTISPSRVAGWLDLHGGKVTAEFRGDGLKGDFRPMRLKKELPFTISWSFDADSSVPLCMAVTPFNGASSSVALEISAAAPLQIGYQNVPIGAMDDIHAGISYDYELFYDILQSKPCPPPVPFGMICEIPTSSVTMVMHHTTLQPRKRPYHDEATGINCGPVKNGG